MGTTKTSRFDVKLQGKSREYYISSPSDFNIAAERNFNFSNTVTHGDNYLDWKARLKEQRSATTSLEGSSWVYKSGGQSTFGRTKEYVIPSLSTRSEWKGDLGAIYLEAPSLSTLAYTNANNSAILAFNRKVQQEITSSQSGIFIGEILKTIRMIRNPAQILNANLYNHVREAPSVIRRRRHLIAQDKPSARETMRLAQDIWLENSFGWQPLVNDIDHGLKALAELAKTTPDSYPIRGRGQEHRYTTQPKVTLSLGGWTVDMNRSLEELVQVLYKGAVSVSPPTAGKQFGISLEQVIPTMWELIPYSFLVDYFSSIGDVINANAWNGAGVRWCEKGTLKQSKNTLLLSNPNVIPINPATGYTLTNPVGRAVPSESISRRLVERTAYYGPWSPSLVFRLPIGPMKWLNMIALSKLHIGASRSVYPGHPAQNLRI